MTPRRPSNLAATLAASALLALGACQPRSFRPVKDFGAPASLDGVLWHCFRQFDLAREPSGRGYLHVTVYKLAYPGLDLNWLDGDWRGHRRLCLEARLADRDSLPFHLSIWDGHGDYIGPNRFQADFALGRDWRMRCVDLGGGLRAEGGRPLRMGHIRRVVLFTVEPRQPLAFDVARVWLE